MKTRKILKLILTIAITTWIIASAFFYFNHRIQVDKYEINKYIEFDDFGILVKNVEIYNFEVNGRNYPDFIYKYDIPYRVASKILEIDYFYSSPYTINKDSYSYDINYEIINNKPFANPNEYSKLFSTSIFQDNSSLFRVTTKVSFSFANNSNLSSATNAVNLQGKSIHSIKLTFNDTNEEYLIEINEPPTTITFDYFNRRKVGTIIEDNDIIPIFLANYYRHEKKDVARFIKAEYLEKFNFDTLDQYETFEDHKYTFSYLGKFMNENQVFIMDVRDDDQAKSLQFYMIYEDLKWVIIDVEG